MATLRTFLKISLNPWLALMLVTMLGSISAWAGGVSSGGGQVVRIDGRYRFLDRVTDSDLKRAEELVDDQKSEYMDFGMALLALRVKQWVVSLTLDLEERLIALPSSVDNKNFDLQRLLTTSGLGIASNLTPNLYFKNSDAIAAGIKPSTRTSPKNQLVVGWFDGEKLFVQPRLFMVLEPLDQEALMLHEAFRYSNHFEDDHSVAMPAHLLTTLEIEKLVQKTMNSIDKGN